MAPRPEEQDFLRNNRSYSIGISTSPTSKKLLEDTHVPYNPRIHCNQHVNDGAIADVTMRVSLQIADISHSLFTEVGPSLGNSSLGGRRSPANTPPLSSAKPSAKYPIMDSSHRDESQQSPLAKQSIVNAGYNADTIVLESSVACDRLANALYAHDKGTPSIEISPGVRVRLRGAAESWSCIEVDFFLPCTCLVCRSERCVIQDALFVLCPGCRVVSPSHGWRVGLRWRRWSRIYYRRPYEMADGDSAKTKGPRCWMGRSIRASYGILHHCSLT